MSEGLALPIDSSAQGQNIIATDGAVGNPSISFINATTSGLYRIGADNYGITVGGVDIMNLTTDKININKPYNISDDTPSAPTVATEGYIYKKLGDDNLYWITQGSGEVKLSTTAATPSNENKDSEFKIFDETNSSRKVVFSLDSLVNDVDHVFTVPQSAGEAGVFPVYFGTQNVITTDDTSWGSLFYVTSFGITNNKSYLTSGHTSFGSDCGKLSSAIQSNYFGYQCGVGTSGGSQLKTASVGAQSNYSTTSNSSTEAVTVGYRASYGHRGNSYSVSIGARALNGVDSQYGTAIGYRAHDAINVSSSSNADNNVVVGCISCTDNGNGAGNVVVGSNTANTLNSGDYNVIVGNNSDVSSSSDSYDIIIGNSITPSVSASINIGKSGTHTTNFQAGIRGVTTANADAVAVLVDSAGQLGTVSSSRRYKENINYDINSNRIYDLSPASFNYKTDESKTITYGLIAEEVESVIPEVVVYKEVDGENIPDTIQYHLLEPLLLDVLKKQKEELDILKELINGY